MFLRIVMGMACFTLAARYGSNVEKKEDNVNYHARLQHTFRANAVRPIQTRRRFAVLYVRSLSDSAERKLMLTNVPPPEG